MTKEERKMGLSFSIVLSWCLFAGASGENPVYFADPNLKTAAERTLYISEPTPTDMLALTGLLGPDAGIVDLTGLEYATNLRRLILRRNRISDLSPLSRLTSLQELWVNVNQVSDISPLSGLTNLHTLLLHNNWISDLSSLSGLTNLEFLDFRNNQVSDLSALAGMTSLHYVDAFNNWIDDLSALLGLTSLEKLELSSNPLNGQAYCSDLQRIVANNPGIDLSYSSNRVPAAGVAASDGTLPDRIRIAWEAVCNGPNYTSHYQVSRSPSLEGARTRISGWQTSLVFDDVTAEPGTIYTYWIRTADPSQSGTTGDYSKPEVGWAPAPAAVTLSSGPGGAVTIPGEGLYTAQVGETVRIQAEPMDANLYLFARWTGTAVQAGLVADANSASTTIAVGSARSTLKASFLSRMDTIYVDDDASDDPRLYTSMVSDPQENGTPEHPFDAIQEGIDVARDGSIVVVRPGTYHECIEFRGRNIKVTGIDPSGSLLSKPFPVLDANYAGTAVTFARGEDPNSVLAGFIITRGKGSATGGIRCENSSPTIANCLIVGNRASNLDYAAVYCRGSDATFVNCTVAVSAVAERTTGIYLSDSDVAFVNSIIWCDVPKDTNTKSRGGGGGRPATTYTCVTDGGSGLGSIDADPLFAQPGWWADPNDPNVVVGSNAPGAIWIAGDYHLKSQAGRWDPKARAWVRDDITSPCIDAGDPNSPVGDEPEPNGGRINMGAYGGTAEASMSLHTGP
jgi:hypothetical protein